jgi:hypothetical protein
MRLDRLPKMAQRSVEMKVIQQLMNFIIGGRQIDFARQRRSEDTM